MKRRDMLKLLGGAIAFPLCGKAIADSNDPEPKEGIHLQSSSYHHIHPHHDFSVLDEHAKVEPWYLMVDKYGFVGHPSYAKQPFDSLVRPYEKYDITEIINEGYIHKVIGRKYFENVQFSTRGPLDEGTKFLQNLIYEEKPVKRSLVFSRQPKFEKCKCWSFTGFIIGVTATDFDFSLDEPIAEIEYTFAIDTFEDWS